MMEETTQDYFQQGEKFRGYVIERELGRGGLGAVYLAKHEVLETLFAIKVLDPAVAGSDATYIKRFLREAKLATRIRHPNLVSVHDCGHDAKKNLYFLVMDYVPGSSLRDVLAIEGRLSPERAADIVAQVSLAFEAVQVYHVVHRDIKPENIMIQPDGRVRLVDLGVAKAHNLGDSMLTSTDTTFGTPSYISPEQAQHAASVDQRADIYSLGIVFFEMLTGKRPYEGRNPGEILQQILSDSQEPDIRDSVPGLPPGLAVLVRRMMIKEMNRRLSSFGSVLYELGKLGLLTDARRTPSAEYAPQPEQGMKTLLNGLDVGESKVASKPKFTKQLLNRVIFVLVALLALGIALLAIVRWM